MTLLELKSHLNPLLITINESEGADISAIKKYLKQFVLSNKANFPKVFPRLLSYIKNIKVSDIIKKNIIRFLSVMILSIGYPALANEVKNIDTITQDYSKPFNYTYNLGEYVFDHTILKDYIKSLKGNKISGTIIVSISKDPENPRFKNFANDDTKEEKLKGGNLLNKRILEVRRVLSDLQKEISPIILDITVKGIVADDRIIKADLSVSSNNKTSIPYVDDSEYKDEDDLNPVSGGHPKDISHMSRNLQFIEILRLVDIDAKPFFNNDISKGDEYSRWIVNVRKNIKSFFSRLAHAYPEYNITFNSKAKVFTDIRGAKRGQSHMANQFKYLETFESFRYTDDVKKWRRILGVTFPYMTEELANKLNTRIEDILAYLEQMYGGTLLRFAYNKKGAI